jgi:hypothetical protein
MYKFQLTDQCVLVEGVRVACAAHNFKICITTVHHLPTYLWARQAGRNLEVHGLPILHLGTGRRYSTLLARVGDFDDSRTTSIAK